MNKKPGPIKNTTLPCKQIPLHLDAETVRVLKLLYRGNMSGGVRQMVREVAAQKNIPMEGWH